MSEISILPVKPGTLSKPDKAMLRKAGVVVVEHPRPEELRLLRTQAELDSSDLLACAMKGLVVESGSYGRDNRDAFVKALNAAVQAKFQPSQKEA